MPRFGYTIVGPDRYGCATHRSKGTYTNTLLISRHALEDRVLSWLKERMMAPDPVAAFVDEFNAGMRKLATSAKRETLAAKRTLAEIERKLAAIVRAIEDGAYTPTLNARLTALEQEKAQTEFSRWSDAPPATPNPCSRYRSWDSSLRRFLKYGRLSAFVCSGSIRDHTTWRACVRSFRG